MKEQRIVFIDYIRVIAVLTFVCCAVTTSLLSRIPGSKWVIGC